MTSEQDSRKTALIIGADEYVATRLINVLASHPLYRPIPVIEGGAQAAWPHLEVRRCDAARPVEFVNALEGVDLS